MKFLCELYLRQTSGPNISSSTIPNLCGSLPWEESGERGVIVDKLTPLNITHGKSPVTSLFEIRPSAIGYNPHLLPCFNRVPYYLLRNENLNATDTKDNSVETTR